MFCFGLQSIARRMRALNNINTNAPFFNTQVGG